MAISSGTVPFSSALYIGPVAASRTSFNCLIAFWLAFIKLTPTLVESTSGENSLIAPLMRPLAASALASIAFLANAMEGS